MEITGTTALVTGAAGGIGRHIAVALSGAGARLVLSGRNAAALEQLRDTLPGPAEVVTADLIDRGELATLLGRAEAAAGPVDILVNNAGVELASAYSAMSFEEVEAILAVNLTAPALLCHQALPLMHGRGRGHIVNIGSLAGYISIPYMQTYCASKGALLRLSNALRAEYAGTGVGLSFVACGYVDGGIYRPIVAAGLKASPLAGVSAPEKVAAAVLDAIRRDRPEVIVNPTPVRPMVLLGVAAPGLAERVSRVLGTDRVFRALSEHRGRGRRSVPG